MPTIKFPHFGNIDSAELEEYQAVEIDFNNTKVQVDINFEGKSIDIKRLEVTRQFIDNMRIHDINNKKYIQKDFDNEDGETVRLYLEHHLEDLATDDIDHLIGANIKSVDQLRRLLSKLHLVRVGLYPHSTDQFATFDYSIGKDFTNYLVVINTDENGNLHYITTES